MTPKRLLPELPLGGYKWRSLENENESRQKKSFDVIHVRACTLFLSLSINNSRERCVFYGSNGLNDGTTKTPQRETMVTFQACPDCPGVANETVPFLVPCPCIRPGQIARDCIIILGLKLAKSNNDSACSQRFCFNQSGS